MMEITNDEIIVRPTGWEWECPECSTTNTMSANYYIPGQPVRCEDCGTEFAYSECWWE